MNQSLNSLEKLLKTYDKDLEVAMDFSVAKNIDIAEFPKKYIKRAYSLGLSDAIKAKPPKLNPKFYKDMFYGAREEGMIDGHNIALDAYSNNINKLRDKQ